MLSDDILLNIFHYYLESTPQIWPTLAWVCQRWRQIIFESPLGLNLQLYCTYGTPVLRTLDYWPALPIVVQYGGLPNLDPPAPEDDENIIAALKQSGRVSSISLTITSSLLERLSAISEPFSELEELTLLSQENIQPTLPSTFRWGPRLRTLRSTRIALPSIPQLLLPSQNLVDLQFHEIPGAGYFPPDTFASALSEMAQLETLSLHFFSLPPRRNYIRLPPQSGERIVLPALTRLKYRGTSKYLDSLVAWIDAPRLGDIDITIFSQPTMDASQIGRFIERIETQASLSEVNVRTSADAISISFTNSSSPASSPAPLRLQIPCKQLDWQLSAMAQVCGQFSPILRRVETVGIDTTQPSSSQDDVDSEQWLEIVRSFGGARDFWVGAGLMTDILSVLGQADSGHTTVAVLPVLRHIRVENPTGLKEPSLDTLWSFITSRSQSGRPVQVNVSFHPCNICNACFGELQGLECHLVDKHTYRRMCSYCSDFERLPGLNSQFREHLENLHPEVLRNDRSVESLSTLFPSDSFVIKHTHLRIPCAPDVVAPSTSSRCRTPNS